jgi:hypothetical protein
LKKTENDAILNSPKYICGKTNYKKLMKNQLRVCSFIRGGSKFQIFILEVKFENNYVKMDLNLFF